MEIHNFDDLVQVAKQQPEPQRLLFLFAKAESESTTETGQERGTIAPVICVDKLPSELSSFQDLVSEADTFKKDWTFVFIAALPGIAGKEPTSEEASPHLEQMTNSIANGMNIHQYLIFDRSGTPVTLNVEH